MTGRADSRFSAALTFGAGFVAAGLLLDVVSVFALDWRDRGHHGTRSAAISEGMMMVMVLALVCSTSYAVGLMLPRTRRDRPGGRLDRPLWAGAATVALIWLVAWFFRDRQQQAVTVVQAGLIVVGPAFAAYVWGVTTTPDPPG